MGPSYSFLVVNLFCLLGQALPASVRYDQSQSGETNIHLDLKNIEILAVLDDTLMGSAQYDDYDYADLTLKPPSKPTFNMTWENNSTTEEGGEGGGLAGLSSIATVVEGPTTLRPNTSATSAKPIRKCGAGFYRDTLGRCRRLRRPHTPILTGLMQKMQANLKASAEKSPSEPE